jgi:DNA-binding response OmpR family regulator
MRNTPLVVVASASPSVADDVAAHLRSEGMVVYVAHGAGGCLRVATSIGPDVVLLDPALPTRLERLLRAHPISAQARILHLSAPRVPARIPRPLRPPAAAVGPHAA